MPHDVKQHTPDEIREFRERQAHKSKDPGRRATPVARKDAPVRDDGADPEGLVRDSQQLLVSASTHILVKDTAAKIHGAYPGWRWAIQPDERGKVFNIFNLDFHDEFGYTIKYTDIQDDPQRKEAIRAAGEILERFGYTHRARPNGPMTYDKDTMANFPRDSRGRVVSVDLAATHARNVSRQVQKKHTLNSAIRDGLAKEVVIGGKRYLRVDGKTF